MTKRFEFDDDLEELDIDEPEQDEAVEETGNKKQRRPKTKKKKVTKTKRKTKTKTKVKKEIKMR